MSPETDGEMPQRPMTAPTHTTANAAENVSRLMRMRPLMLYALLIVLGAIAYWVESRNLDDQRKHLLEHHGNLMAWSAFVVESPLISTLEPLAFEAHKSFLTSFKPEDFAPADDAAKQALRLKLDEWSATRTRMRPLLTHAVSVVDNDARLLGGTPIEIPTEELERYKQISTRGSKPMALIWQLTPAADTPDGEPCIRYWTPIYLRSTLQTYGAVIYTLKLKGLGTQESVNSPKRMNLRMISQIMRQAGSRGLTVQNKEGRTLILGTDFRVIQTRSGEQFFSQIPDPGERFEPRELRVAYDTATREKLGQILFSTPATGDTPACHCLLDLSTAERGYVILVQTAEAAILEPWDTAKRNAGYSAALLLGLFSLAVLFDFRRRQNHANLAVLTTRLSEQLAREEEMSKAQAVLEARVAERTAELAEANLELTAYAHTVSHDLRSPLRAVRNRVLILREDHPEIACGEAGEHFERIVANVDHMSQLIEDILTLSKIGRSKPLRQPCDLAAMVREIGGRLRETWPNVAVTLVAPESCVVEADPALIRIALENLLGNAWKYSSKTPGPRVEFGVRAGAEGRAEYFVRDNGAGFPSEYANKLFVPFVRLHSANEFEGTGLGLATAARIIRLHGGAIHAEGAKGEGACFSFTLGNA